MSKEYKKELYYLFGVDKNIKMIDPEIQIDHLIMIKRNIFDRQCIYNPEDIIKIIKSKKRENAGKTLPPQGLYLVKVEYSK